MRIINQRVIKFYLIIPIILSQDKIKNYLGNRLKNSIKNFFKINISKFLLDIRFNDDDHLFEKDQFVNVLYKDDAKPTNHNYI